jgi:hypothetical protein
MESSMKKLGLAAILLVVGTLGAEAQSPSRQDGTRSGGGSRSTTGTPPAKAAPAPVAAKPAPAPVRVFVPVPVPAAPVWNRGEHRYSQRNHRVCQQKSHQLHSYERHAADDGFLSPRERRTIVSLKQDLDRTCGGHRWRG